MSIAQDIFKASSPVMRALMGDVLAGLLLVVINWAAPVLTPIMEMDATYAKPGSAHFGRVTHVVEVDVGLDPADVGLLRATGIVFEADGRR